MGDVYRKVFFAFLLLLAQNARNVSVYRASDRVGSNFRCLHTLHAFGRDGEWRQCNSVGKDLCCLHCHSPSKHWGSRRVV